MDEAGVELPVFDSISISPDIGFGVGFGGGVTFAAKHTYWLHTFKVFRGLAATLEEVL